MQRVANVPNLRLGLASTGALCLASAAFAFEQARQHMLFLGSLCGANPHPHCAWCFAAAGLAVVGAGLLALALRAPERR